MSETPRIPAIDDQVLSELSRRIRPVVREGETLHYIERCDPRTVAFTWALQTTEPALGLKRLRTVTTFHTYGAPSLFKPSIAEVISQIPEDLLTTVRAFELDVNSARLTDDKLNHAAETTLYRWAQEPVIKPGECRRARSRTFARLASPAPAG